MNDRERQAWRHYSTTVKMGSDPSPARIRVSKKSGWLTEDPEVLQLLTEGYDNFILTTANRILQDNIDEVKFNNCPNCGRLTRTPKAKQCRHCGHDWH